MCMYVRMYCLHPSSVCVCACLPSPTPSTPTHPQTDRQRTDAALVWRSPLPSSPHHPSKLHKKDRPKPLWEHIPLLPHLPNQDQVRKRLQEAQAEADAAEGAAKEVYIPNVYSDRYVAEIDARAR